MGIVWSVPRAQVKQQPPTVVRAAWHFNIFLVEFNDPFLDVPQQQRAPLKVDIQTRLQRWFDRVARQVSRPTRAHMLWEAVPYPTVNDVVIYFSPGLFYSRRHPPAASSPPAQPNPSNPPTQPAPTRSGVTFVTTPLLVQEGPWRDAVTRDVTDPTEQAALLAFPNGYSANSLGFVGGMTLVVSDSTQTTQRGAMMSEVYVDQYHTGNSLAGIRQFSTDAEQVAANGRLLAYKAFHEAGHNKSFDARDTMHTAPGLSPVLHGGTLSSDEAMLQGGAVPSDGDIRFMARHVWDRVEQFVIGRPFIV